MVNHERLYVLDLACQKVSNKSSRVLGIMNRMKHFLPFSALWLTYQSFVNCHLQFCLLAWGYEYNRAYNLQKKAVRIMTASKYNAHTEPLFKQFNIMKLEDSLSLQCLKFYHKLKGNSLPKYLADIFTRNSDIYHYGTRNRDQLHYFPFKKTDASKCVRLSEPNLLNEIDPIVHNNLDTLSLVLALSTSHLLSMLMIQFVIFKIVTSVTISSNGLIFRILISGNWDSASGCLKGELVLTITPAGTQNEPTVILLFCSSNMNIIFAMCSIHRPYLCW